MRRDWTREEIAQLFDLPLTELLFRANSRDSPGLFNPRNGQLLTTSTIEPTPDGLEQRIKIRRAGSDEFELHEAFSRKIKDRYTMAIVGIDEATGKYYVLTDAFSDLVQARMYDPATRKFDDELLLAHPKIVDAAAARAQRHRPRRTETGQRLERAAVEREAAGSLSQGAVRGDLEGRAAAYRRAAGVGIGA